eukprot:scaffold2684_cov124-Isochrysis_galbana.AAC.2
MRLRTALRVSTPEFHHRCSASVESTSTLRISPCSACVIDRPNERSARSIQAWPRHDPIVSSPPRFFFSRNTGLSTSGGKAGEAVGFWRISTGVMPKSAVWRARDSGELHTASAPKISPRSSVSLDDEGATEPLVARSQRCEDKARACRTPMPVSWWSTPLTKPTTSRRFCASFQRDCPWRTR